MRDDKIHRYAVFFFHADRPQRVVGVGIGMVVMPVIVRITIAVAVAMIMVVTVIVAVIVAVVMIAMIVTVVMTLLGRAGADALHVMMVAFLRQADLGLETQYLLTVFA